MTNELQLHQISVSEMDNNCYLLQAGEEGLLVDAADDAPALLDMAQKAGVKITAVLTTHRHWDHVRALKEVLSETGAIHYASFLDSPAIPAEVDVELREGDSIKFAGLDLPIIILRGHTPGGAALASATYFWRIMDGLVAAEHGADQGGEAHVGDPLGVGAGISVGVMVTRL